MEYHVKEDASVKLVTSTDRGFIDNNDGMDINTRSVVKPAAKIHMCDKTIDEIIMLAKSDNITAYDLNSIIDTVEEIDSSILSDIANTIFALLIEKKASLVVDLKNAMLPNVSKMISGTHPLFDRYELEEDENDEIEEEDAWDEDEYDVSPKMTMGVRVENEDSEDTVDE